MEHHKHNILQTEIKDMEEFEVSHNFDKKKFLIIPLHLFHK